mmetsp:Transcript_10495/g.42361  ORF Transcript_10495/g.42361 Transcript_10495/m.42361 type:complete len:209 (-) Transcript_10495:151-777(-)
MAVRDRNANAAATRAAVAGAVDAGANRTVAITVTLRPVSPRARCTAQRAPARGAGPGGGATAAPSAPRARRARRARRAPAPSAAPAARCCLRAARGTSDPWATSISATGTAGSPDARRTSPSSGPAASSAARSPTSTPKASSCPGESTTKTSPRKSPSAQSRPRRLPPGPKIQPTRPRRRPWRRGGKRRGRNSPPKVHITSRRTSPPC